ncbi:S8 family serine peptidase [Phycisphaerales bacterium AB-hyl4]|uniref:S8 family serine peptidase n=1 Tax=Natronomicrosphaera hydrolytica TaxID=3242702 RepID=A0ABV4U6K8_9BACT
MFQHAVLAGAIVLAALTSAAHGVSSSSNGLIDVNITELLGIDLFHNAGYTGERAVVGVIESGHLWSDHQTLRHVDTFIQSPQARFGSTQLGDVNRHATFVAGLIGGRPADAAVYKTGFAPGAEMWSGAIATQWFNTPSVQDSFTFADHHALVYPFLTMMRTGVENRRADVINFSVGLGAGSAAADISARVIDSLTYENRQSVIVSAGNSGPSSGSVNRPADAYNVITVGALARGTATPYANVAGFSSRGPGNFYNPVTGETVPNARALVDIVAPGQNLIAPFYGGTTGQNTGGTDISNGRGDRYAGYNPPNGPNVGGPVSGTSFSAPLVSGTAALLADVGHDRYPSHGTDGRVIKAVLLTSAQKPGPWSNGQTVDADGVVRTTQALDYTFGAGRLDAGAAFTLYTTGTTDLPGHDGGLVAELGWDFGMVGENTPTDYLIDVPLAAGSTFTATLTWFAERTFENLAWNGVTTVSDNRLDNLDLQLWQLTGPDSAEAVLIAESVSEYNTVEHFSILIPEAGEYMLRVLWENKWYDRLGGANVQEYALAWHGIAVPEPGTLVIVLALSVTMLRSHRGRRVA